MLLILNLNLNIFTRSFTTGLKRNSRSRTGFIFLHVIYSKFFLYNIRGIVWLLSDLWNTFPLKPNFQEVLKYAIYETCKLQMMLVDKISQKIVKFLHGETFLFQVCQLVWIKKGLLSNFTCMPVLAFFTGVFQVK